MKEVKEVIYAWKGIKYEDLTQKQMLEALRYFTKKYWSGRSR